MWCTSSGITRAGKPAAAPREPRDRRRGRPPRGAGGRRRGRRPARRSRAASGCAGRGRAPRIRVGHRAGRADRRAGAAAHAQVRLDDDVVAVGADRRGRADVDALRAAGLLRAACAQIDALYAKNFGFSNSPVIAASSATALRLRERHRRPARNSPAAAGACATAASRCRSSTRSKRSRARGVAAREIDRAGRAARGDALAVRLAAVEVDLVAPVDRLLGAGADARIAARAEVEIDRILLRPRDVERAEPAGERRDLARVDRIRALGRQLGAGRAAGGEHRHGELRRQRVGPVQRRVRRADDQQLALRIGR